MDDLPTIAMASLMLLDEHEDYQKSSHHYSLPQMESMTVENPLVPDPLYLSEDKGFQFLDEE